MLTQTRINNIDLLLKKLAESSNKWMSLAIAIDLADEVMKGILPEKKDWHSILSRDVQNTGNPPEPHPMDTFSTQKQYTWFNEHPDSGSARSAFKHFYARDSIIESNFYWFSESATKQKISAATQFLPNWEDSNLTRNSNYKIGIDFFLTHDQKKVLIVVTNNQNLRVLELTDELSNTQKQIFNNSLFNIPEEKFGDNNHETKRILHDYIWNALQLKEVNNKFYKGIVQHFETLTNAMINLNDKSEDDAKQFSTRLIGRLLFVWFLRKMDIVNNRFSYFDTERRSSTEYYREELKILFFEILNAPIENRKTLDTETPYLNGGLFEVKENDYFYQELIFPEDYFKSLYNHFDEFNFTTDESSADYELIAVDPEMLGQVFESLLDSQLNEEGSSERHDTGSFYTPREIVNYMCKESLRQYLYNQVDNVSFNDGIDKLLDMSDAKFMEMKSSSTVDLWGVNTKNVLSKIDSALNDVKIIDPAVGSGAFPIGMMQLMLKLYERIKPIKVFNSYKMKLAIVKNNIYGVDNQPMATEITRLRAWLSIIVEDANKKNIEPLPNLDFKFISANSIVKLDRQNNLWSDPELDNKLNEIRAKYFNARKPEKKKEWQDYYFSLTQNIGLFDDRRTQQLKSFNPFSNTSAADFYESKIMFGIEEGFDIVIGNPPYLLEGKAPKYNFENISYYQGKMDIWYSFACVGIDLLKDKGILSFIATDKWFTNTGASLMRNKIIEETRLLEIKDFSNNMVFDSATVQTMILTLQKDSEIDNYSFSYSKMDKNNTSLSSFIQSEGQDTYLQPIINRDKYIDQFLVFSKHDNILNKIAECSSYLLPSEVANGIHPHYDFVNLKLSKKYNIDVGIGIFGLSNQELNEIDPTTEERKLIKPYYTSEQVKRYFTEEENKLWLIYTSSTFKNPRSMDDYPNLKKHLDKYKNIISSDNKPYGLHRSRKEEFFKGEKIAALRKSPKIPIFSYSNFDCYLPASYYVIKTTRFSYKYLLGLLNSKLIAFWLKYKGKMQGENYQLDKTPLLQIPIKSSDTIEIIEDIVDRILECKNKQANTRSLENEIDDYIYEIYDISKEERAVIEESLNS